MRPHGQGPYPVVVVGECVIAKASFHVPKLDCVVPTSTEQMLGIRGGNIHSSRRVFRCRWNNILERKEYDIGNGVIMTPQSADAIVGCKVPEFDRQIVGARC